MDRAVGHDQIDPAGMATRRGRGAPLVVDGRVEVTRGAAAARATGRVRRHDVIVASRDEVAVGPVPSGAADLMCGALFRHHFSAGVVHFLPCSMALADTKPVAGHIDPSIGRIAEDGFGEESRLRGSVVDLLDRDDLVGQEDAVVLLEAADHLARIVARVSLVVVFPPAGMILAVGGHHAVFIGGAAEHADLGRSRYLVD